MKNHRLSLADVLDDCLMYTCIGMVALGVLTGEAHCQTLPEAPVQVNALESILNYIKVSQEHNRRGERASMAKEVDPSLVAYIAIFLS